MSNFRGPGNWWAKKRHDFFLLNAFFKASAFMPFIIWKIKLGNLYATNWQPARHNEWTKSSHIIVIILLPFVIKTKDKSKLHLTPAVLNSILKKNFYTSFTIMFTLPVYQVKRNHWHYAALSFPFPHKTCSVFSLWYRIF